MADIGKPVFGTPYGDSGWCCCEDHECKFTWGVIWDCAASTWGDILLLTVECVPGDSCTESSEWECDKATPNLYTYVTCKGSCSDPAAGQPSGYGCDRVTPEPPDSDTLPADPECKCTTIWESTYDCDTDEWGVADPVGALTCVVDCASSVWYLTTNDCVARRREPSSTVCTSDSGCTEGVGEPPSPPTREELPPGPTCCTLCSYTFSSIYNCETQAWGDVYPEPVTCEICTNTDWDITDPMHPCVAYTTICGSHCTALLDCGGYTPPTTPDPPPDTLVPDTKCCSKCSYLWNSTYDCGTDTWGPVTQGGVYSCVDRCDYWSDVLAGWTVTPGSCIATRVTCGPACTDETITSDCGTWPTAPDKPTSDLVPVVDESGALCCRACAYTWSIDYACHGDIGGGAWNDYPTTPDTAICTDDCTESAWSATPDAPCTYTATTCGKACYNHEGDCTIADSPTPPANTLPSAPSDLCCFRCAYTWSADYDCVSGIWTTNHTPSVDCTDACINSTAWEVDQFNPLIATWTYCSSKACDGEITSCGDPDFTPSDCAIVITNGCWCTVRWTAEYDCNIRSWQRVQEYSDCAPNDGLAGGEWRQTTDAWHWEYINPNTTRCTGESDCSDIDPGFPPEDPVCYLCEQDYIANFDCPTQTWSMTPTGDSRCVETAGCLPHYDLPPIWVSSGDGFSATGTATCGNLCNTESCSTPSPASCYYPPLWTPTCTCKSVWSGWRFNGCGGGGVTSCWCDNYNILEGTYCVNPGDCTPDGSTVYCGEGCTGDGSCTDTNGPCSTPVGFYCCEGSYVDNSFCNHCSISWQAHFDCGTQTWVPDGPFGGCGDYGTDCNPGWTVTGCNVTGVGCYSGDPVIACTEPCCWQDPTAAEAAVAATVALIAPPTDCCPP